MTPGRLSYRFGPIERRGILGPVRVGQAAVLALGALLAILALDRSPTATGAILATLLFGGSILVAVTPIGARTIEQWAPVAFALLLRRLSGRTGYRSALPSQGLAARTRNKKTRLGHPDPDTPRSVREVRIVSLDYRDRTIGAL